MKHKQALQEAKKLFLAKQPSEIVAATGALYQKKEKIFTLPYFGEQFFINHQDGTIEGEKELDESDCVIIMQYLGAKERIIPSGEWKSFLELPGGPNHYPPFVKRGIEPLAKNFGERLSLFSQKCSQMGGREIKMGDKGFWMPAFPYLPLAVAVYAPDEEFSAGANILFDSTNSSYLATASLYILGINLSFKLRGEKIVSG